MFKSLRIPCLALAAATLAWVPPARAQPMDIGTWVVERNLIVDGPVRIEGALNVGGNADVKGPVETAAFMNLPPGVLPVFPGRPPRHIHDPLTVHGSLTVDGDLLVHGPVSVAGPIRIFGNLNAAGPVRERR